MPKILKPYTIIPSSLYVHRDADRQIKNIINDMGRPGYVLVSRQMGKTNLLLNAKRELESPDDVFVYIDLSNGFDTARDCFENIIDIAIETNYEKFNTASKLIKERRSEIRDTPPHKQHLNELRLLLKEIKGKFIIILDEIDALTKTSYSDQIFAQIRSIYFSRVNFQELENLTYILSGVIEPSEIIKDQKISPFNIGQKIFLNDFNEEEFSQLLTNSKIELEQEIRDRIFYWTAGNPRITWDICSEIENRISQNENLTIELIDLIVKEMYLIKFDKPPIDHIRELLENDREIRNSIIEIEYEKGKEVSDKIKSKLYLAGIINYDDDEIHIKNRIIKEALNLNWIKSLEEEEKGFVKLAIEKFESEKFNESLELFERFLEDNEFEEADISLCYYYMGYASYRASLFHKTINYLNNTRFDIEDEAKLYYRCLNLKGLALYYERQISKSLSCFKEIMKSGRKDEIFARAVVSYGVVIVESNETKHREDAKEIFKDISNGIGLDNEKLKEPFIKEMKSIANFNLAQIFQLDGNTKEASIHYKKAIELGKDNNKPSILLALLKITNKNEEKYELLNQLILLLDDKNIEPTVSNIENQLNFSFDDLKSIAIISYIDFRDTLFEKIKLHLNKIGDFPLAKHLYDLAVFSVAKNQERSITTKILSSIKENFENIEYGVDKEIKYKTLKGLAHLTNINETNAYHIEYCKLFNEENFEEIDVVDLELFASLVYTLSEKKKYKDALEYIEIINSKKDTVSDEYLINYLVIYHLELNIYYYTNKRTKTIEKAKEIIDLANDNKIKKKTSNLLGETGLDVIRQNAETILKPVATPQKPRVSAKKYGRNEFVKVRYKDGTIIETKFKKVEKDLSANECFILN